MYGISNIIQRVNKTVATSTVPGSYLICDIIQRKGRKERIKYARKAQAIHDAERKSMVHGSGSMDHAIANDSFAAKRESFASYERAQERAVAYTVLAKRGTLAQYAVPSKVQ